MHPNALTCISQASVCPRIYDKYYPQFTPPNANIQHTFLHKTTNVEKYMDDHKFVIAIGSLNRSESNPNEKFAKYGQHEQKSISVVDIEYKCL